MSQRRVETGPRAFRSSRQAALASAFALLLFGASCAPRGLAEAPQAEPPGPRSEQPHSAASPEQPAATAQTGPAADVLYPAPEAVPAPASDCVTAGALPSQASCQQPRQELALALAKSANDRDEALAALEVCDAFPAGLLRALRAELYSADCADQLVAAVVGEAIDSSGIRSDLRQTLVALGLGARLRRLATTPPAAPKERSREKLDEYFQQVLFPWISEQAGAIFALSSQGTQLAGYAQGIVATEAGNADMRFVEIARAVPLSADIARHPEARDVYYAGLDEALESRKARGRNAALVGLRQMAQSGVRESARVADARRLLSLSYGGRRVNALDTLLLPPLAPQKAVDAFDAIASLVPTPYASALVGPRPVSAHLVRAHLQAGMPRALRQAVMDDGQDARAQLYLARGWFESGRTYFRASDFQQSQSILHGLLDGDAALDSEEIQQAGLLRALSVALMAGPKDAAEMMARGPRFADLLGNLALLDALAEKNGELAGMAGFNAAYLRELVAPADAPDYWDDLSQRYQSSAQKLAGKQAGWARDRASACRQIAQTLREQVGRTKP